MKVDVGIPNARKLFDADERGRTRQLRATRPFLFGEIGDVPNHRPERAALKDRELRQACAGRRVQTIERKFERDAERFVFRLPHAFAEIGQEFVKLGDELRGACNRATAGRRGAVTADTRRGNPTAAVIRRAAAARCPCFPKSNLPVRARR